MNTVYNVIFYPEPEGGFTAVVPTLQGCVSYGRDLIEAQRMIEDAIAVFVSSLRKHHEPIPSDILRIITPPSLLLS